MLDGRNTADVDSGSVQSGREQRKTSGNTLYKEFIVMATKYFNLDNESVVKNETLYLRLPKRHILSANITISRNTLTWAERQGAHLVQVEAGSDIYRATMEKIRYEGHFSEGYYHLPVFRWKQIQAGKQKVEGRSKRLQKGITKIRKKYGASAINSGIEKWGGAK
jgi:hypothetical protein